MQPITRNEKSLNNLMDFMYGAPNSSIFHMYFYGFFDFLYGQLDILYSQLGFLCGQLDFFYGQLNFLCGQLYTFYVVNSTFYMVSYTLFIWSTRLFMWLTIYLLYGQRDLFTAKYKLFIRPGNALRDQTQTKLRKLSSPRTLFETFELLKKHESKHS